MTNPITLEQYILERKKQLKKINAEISLLTENLSLPIKVSNQSEQKLFILNDYSLAEDFEIIKTRGKYHISGGSDPEGGLDYTRYIFYPQFHMFLKNEFEERKVLIEHDSFEKDIEKITLRSFLETSAWGHYCELYPEFKLEPYEDNNLYSALEFFRDLGVNESLLSDIEIKSKNIGKVSGF